MTENATVDENGNVQTCERCPNLVECRSRIVNGVGPADADVVLVGEAPGAQEDETGEPFVGRSGSILNEALDEAGLERSDIRIMNCVRCRPPDNRDPHVAEREHCRAHLKHELEAVDPAVVVPLGRIPVEELVGDIGKVTDVAGESLSAEVGDWAGVVVASVHPAATIYNRSLRPTFNETFQTVADRAVEQYSDR